VRRIVFDKYEALGNDFIVVEGTSALLTVDQVRAICDRHRGVGADGVLFTGVSANRPFLQVVNADGSRAEMCGNGLRCVALHLVRRGLVDTLAFEVDTDAGPHGCRVLKQSPVGRVEVVMRPPSVDPAQVPVHSPAPLVDATLPGIEVRITAVSMGNPHAVTFDVEGDARLALGPRIQEHPAFPEKANVGFARMRGASSMVLDVYERGAGWTQACGTGACAAAFAAVQTGRAARGTPIEVVLPGGPLEIVVGAPGERIRMTGPARYVFSGKLDL
jgi:diaminopimelate epimerase